MIRAILRAQWRSMRMFRLASGRRGAVFTLIIGTLWYGFWSFLALLAEELLAAPALRAQIEEWLPIGLLVLCADRQLAPLASASMGASLDLRKLLLYPVRRGSLFTVEILLRLTTWIELLLLLIGAAVGLLRNPAFGAWRSAPRIIPAVVLFAAFNVLLAAGLRSLIERLLNRRGIREIVALLLVLAGVLPRLVMVTGMPVHGVQRFLPATGNVAWPWGAAARGMLAVPENGSALAALGALLLWTAAAFVFGRWQFTRSLRFDFQAAQATVTRTKQREWAGRLYRLPSMLLPDPVAALVEKEIRSLIRTPRFRLVFVMGFTFGLIVWLPMVLRPQASHSVLSENFLAAVSLYALTLLGQVTYWNAFGFDRSAAVFYFVAPVPISRALIGKNITGAVFILLEIAAVGVACSLLHVGITPAKILETLLVTAVAALYLLALGNLSSIHYPRAMSPQRVSSGAGRTQGLLFLLYPVALLPILLAYLARYAFKNNLIFWIILLLAAALGAAIYWMAMESAVSTAQKRRETIIAELSRGEGPIAAE